jgi:phage gpG-like protein
MIKGWVVGDKEVVARLAAMPERLHAGILRTVMALCLTLQGKVRYKLSDDVLHVRTGTLRRSITQRVDDSKDSISGIVGTNVAYAARHEYGFSGTESVKEHLRTIKKAFGKEIKGGSVTFSVRAHSRKVNYPPHSFLRSALAEMEPQIKAALERAVAEAVKPA